MDITNNLLVAIMYVVILSMGIGHILGGLAALVGKRTEQKTDRLQASWMVLLLLAYFNLFWHTIDLLAVEDWAFLDFLYVMAGPILIFFATTVFVPNAPPEGTSPYYSVSRRFFTLLAIVQLWILGADFVLGRGLPAAAAFNIAAVGLFATLAMTQRPRMHSAGNGLAWLLFVAMVSLRGLGVLS